MDLENKNKFPKSFTYFEVAFITLALIIGFIIHELDISSITKVFIAAIIIVIIIFLEKIKWWDRWKFTKIGRINRSVFWGYIIIAYIVFSVLSLF